MENGKRQSYDMNIMKFYLNFLMYRQDFSFRADDGENSKRNVSCFSYLHFFIIQKTNNFDINIIKILYFDIKFNQIILIQYYFIISNTSIAYQNLIFFVFFFLSSNSIKIRTIKSRINLYTQEFQKFYSENLLYCDSC